MAADAFPYNENGEVEEREEKGEAAMERKREEGESPHSRPLGPTEKNWIDAVESGTGNTVIGLKLKLPLELNTLQKAVEKVQMWHPRTRSRLVRVNGRPTFQVADKPNVLVELVEEFTLPPDSDDDFSGSSSEDQKLGRQKTDESDSSDEESKQTNGEEKKKERMAEKEEKERMEGRERMEERERIEEREAIEERERTEEKERKILTEKQENVPELVDGSEDDIFHDAVEEQHPEEGEVEKAGEVEKVGEVEKEGVEEEEGEESTHVQENRKCEAEEFGGEESALETPFSLLGKGEKFRLSICEARWLRIVEFEMNTSWWPEKSSQDDIQKPLDLLQVRLYRLKYGRSLVLIKAHTCACDRVSAAIIASDLVKALCDVIQQKNDVTQQRSGVTHQKKSTEEDKLLSCPKSTVEDGEKEKKMAEEEEEEEKEKEKEKEATEVRLTCVEDNVPRGKGRKPFWAHGIDVIGYGLGSRRHALLPFSNTQDKRKSRLIRSGLNREDTDALLQKCTEEKLCPTAIISACALKAAAQCKNLGNRNEHFGVTTLLDCRSELEPSMPQSTVGFYHSALLHTHQVGENTDLWDLARRCQKSMDGALNHRKHFTDMGDLNMLMAKAMRHPNLTPASSLRTSLVSIFWSMQHENMQKYADTLGIEDYVGCSSIHGVGPCLGIFDSIREDGLHLANVYASPLFTRGQIKELVCSMMDFLKSATV